MSYELSIGDRVRLAIQVKDGLRLSPIEPSLNAKKFPLLAHISDGKVKDHYLVEWVGYKGVKGGQITYLNLNRFDPKTGITPLQLATVYGRTLTVHALLRAGSHPWLNATGCLAAMAPIGVHLEDHFSKGADRPKRLKNWPRNDEDISVLFSGSNHAAVWFDLAENIIKYAVHSASSSPDSVVKFLASVMPAWVGRPLGISRSWSDVMTSTLDSMVLFWKENRKSSFPDRELCTQYATAIQCLIEHGADPNPDRMVTDQWGKSCPWFEFFMKSITPDSDRLPSIMQRPLSRILFRMNDIFSKSAQSCSNAAGEPRISSSQVPFENTGSVELVNQQRNHDVSRPGSSPWVVDVENFPHIAEKIVAGILPYVVGTTNEEMIRAMAIKGQGISWPMLAIPIGQHAVLGMDRRTGEVVECCFRTKESIEPSLKVAVLRVLSDVLDKMPQDPLLAAANSSMNFSWIDAFAYPGVRNDFRKPIDVKFRFRSLADLLNAWTGPADLAATEYSKGLEISIQRRFVSRLASTSLDETCDQIVNTFMSEALAAHLAYRSDPATPAAVDSVPSSVSSSLDGGKDSRQPGRVVAPR